MTTPQLTAPEVALIMAALGVAAAAAALEWEAGMESDACAGSGPDP